MGKGNFYLTEKKLVEEILRYHIWVDRNHVRVEIVTFAKDVTTIIAGITNLTSVHSKCSLFSEYQNKILYNDSRTVSDGTYIKDAYMKASEILETGILYYIMIYCDVPGSPCFRESNVRFVSFLNFLSR